MIQVNINNSPSHKVQEGGATHCNGEHNVILIVLRWQVTKELFHFLCHYSN